MSSEKNNVFRDDEIVMMIHVDKKSGEVFKTPYPKIGGRLRLAHEENGSLSIATEIIRYEEAVAVVKASATTSKGTFSGLGMASVERDQRIAPAILELAETRAIARSLRFAGYGVEYCSAEEVSHLENGDLMEQDGEPSGESGKDGKADPPAKKPDTESTKDDDGQSPKDTRLTSKQLNFINKICRDQRMTKKELSKLTMQTYRVQPEYLTKAQASELIDQLLAS